MLIFDTDKKEDIRTTRAAQSAAAQQRLCEKIWRKPERELETLWWRVRENQREPKRTRESQKKSDS